MATKNEIVNIALIRVGNSKFITDIDTDVSEEASIIKRLYDMSLEAMLTKHFWSFARTFRALTLIEEDPLEEDLDVTEFPFSYVYPEDCLYIKRIVNNISREPHADEKVFFHEAFDRENNRKIIYTDMEDAVIEYTTNDVTEAEFPAYFSRALTYMLAYEMSMSILSSNSTSVSDKLYPHYQKNLFDAIEVDANSQQNDPRPIDSFTRSRFNRYTRGTFRGFRANDSRRYFDTSVERGRT